jgi:hypothetical protein
LSALKVFKKYFQCGNIYENKRSDNHNENLCRYCVRSIIDLQTKIIPFFQKNKLLTSKRNDFEIFCEIFKLILKKEHLNNKGIAKIAKLIQKMNRKKLSRFLESPETTR